MSAPRTNIETQKHRHKGPLIGMAVVVVFALTLLLWLTMRTVQDGQPAPGETTQIDGRTGDTIEPDPPNPEEVPSDPVPPETDLPAAPATPDTGAGSTTP